MGKDMSTPLKRWPNECEWARIDSISLSIEARNAMKEALPRIHDEDAIRKITEALDHCWEIQIKLHMVGPTKDKFQGEKK